MVTGLRGQENIELIIDSGNRLFINIDDFVHGKNREGQNKAKSATVCKKRLELAF